MPLNCFNFVLKNWAKNETHADWHMWTKRLYQSEGWEQARKRVKHEEHATRSLLCDLGNRHTKSRITDHFQHNYQLNHASAWSLIGLRWIITSNGLEFRAISITQHRNVIGIPSSVLEMTNTITIRISPWIHVWLHHSPFGARNKSLSKDFCC